MGQCHRRADQRCPSVRAYRVFLGVSVCMTILSSLQLLRTERFGSLSVQWKELLQRRAPFITTGNILQLVRQCSVTYSSSGNTVTNFRSKFAYEYRIPVLITSHSLFSGCYSCHKGLTITFLNLGPGNQIYVLDRIQNLQKLISWDEKLRKKLQTYA